MTERIPFSAIENLGDGGNNANSLKGAASSETPGKSMSSNEHIKYKQLLSQGKAAAAEGELTLSLVAFQEAYRMHPSEKILKRIEKIKAFMEEIDTEEEEDDFVKLDNGLIIYRELVESLYPHQIAGIKWMYNLNKKKKGGILADDMGLGKTIQVISFISAAFDMDIVKNALLVMPLSLIPNWEKEFEKWAPGIVTKRYYGRDRAKVLDYCQRKTAICLTSYGLAQTQWEALGTTRSKREFVWDYIILDEGHKIKNPTKTTKALHAIPSHNRLLLTGTPIQNNLRELWALFDWVSKGTLLGTQKTFKTEYDLPITRARERGASAAEIHLGNYMSESLQKIIEPYLLRRTKKGVSMARPEGRVDENQNEEVGIRNQPSFPKLETKNDFVIWTYLSAVQEEIYRNFIDQDSVKDLLATKRSPLVYLTVLKKICDHPRLLSRSACQQLGFGADDSLQEEDFHTDVGKECAANRIDNISDETLIEESGKLQFLFGLLDHLTKERHRTLIFSQSRKILNIIQKILINRNVKVMRMDGTVKNLQDRELRVQKFQEDPSYTVFLLTTQVGGVGLTLTAADRVVIYDPSWNPATDAQAVDRIYRIGQEKNVIVYRLITCGTVEEKIYRRQIFKDSIIKQSTGDNKDPYRYFTKGDLKELFEFQDSTSSMTQRQLQNLHSKQRDLAPDVAEHLAQIHVLRMFGVSDHDLMFSQEPDDVNEGIIDSEKDVIHSKVEQARTRIEVEASAFTGSESTEIRWGAFDTKSKEISPRAKENEPSYPIDGLYQKFNEMTFNLPDIGAREIENKIDSDHHSASKEANEPIYISDESENDAEEMGKCKKDVPVGMLVADSPMIKEADHPDIDITEIDESIYLNLSLSEEEMMLNSEGKDGYNSEMSDGNARRMSGSSRKSEPPPDDTDPEKQHTDEGLMLVSDNEELFCQDAYADNEGSDFPNISQSLQLSPIPLTKQTHSYEDLRTNSDEEQLPQHDSTEIDTVTLHLSRENSNASRDNEGPDCLNISQSSQKLQNSIMKSKQTHSYEDPMTNSDEEHLAQHDSTEIDSEALHPFPENCNESSGNEEPDCLNISQSSQKLQTSTMKSKQIHSYEDLETNLDQERLVQHDSDKIDWEGLNSSLENSNQRSCSAERDDINISMSSHIAPHSPNKLISDPEHPHIDEDMMTESDEELLLPYDFAESDCKEVINSPENSHSITGASNIKQNDLSLKNLAECSMQEMLNSSPLSGNLHLSSDSSDFEDEQLSNELPVESEMDAVKESILLDEELEEDQSCDEEETTLDIDISLLSEPSPMTQRSISSRARCLNDESRLISESESPLNYAAVRRKNKRRSTALPAVISSDESSNDEMTM